MGAFVNLAALSTYVDFLNIMTYDFHGPWEPAWAPHANLYGGDISVDSAVNMYLNEGFPANKLVVGIPFYGKAWGMSDVSPLYKNITCNGTHDGAACSVNGQWGHTLHYDTAKQAAFIDGLGHYISYDNLVSVGWKTTYINNRNLGGAMYWSALQDSAGRDLTNKIWTDIGQSGGGGGSAPPVNGNAYTIRPSHSAGKCADVEGYSLSNGANISQYDCHSNYNQRFWAVDRGAGYFAFVNAGSGKCLDQNPGTTNGLNVVQWACHYGDNQLWQAIDSGGGHRLVNKSSGKVLEVSGLQSQSNGANIQVWGYDGSADMKWNFVGVGGHMAFRSYNFGSHFITSRGGTFEVWIETNTSDDSAYRIVPGLADNACVSFQSKRYPDRYLRHSGYWLWSHQNTGGPFAGDATFCPRASLVGDGGYRSFESKNFPNHYIRHSGGRLRIDAFVDTPTFRADASWQYNTR